MKVVSNYVAVIEPETSEKKSSGGIIITSNDDFRTPVSCKVVAVGPDVKTVAVDDVVYVLPKTGDTLTLDGVKYRVFAETSVLAIV